METKEWLALENTQSLIKFIKEEVQNLGKDVLSGSASSMDNADITQYMSGKTTGLYTAYALVLDKMNQEVTVDPEVGEEYYA